MLENIIRLDLKDRQLTPTEIRKLVEYHKNKCYPRLSKLKNYYNGEHDILKRHMEDHTKPNNKIVNNYASYIVDTIAGFFLGKQVSYVFDENVHEFMTEVYRDNKEASHNYRIGRNMGIYGEAFELLYMDSNAKLKMESIDPRQFLPIYGENINSELELGIWYREQQNLFGKGNIMLVNLYYNNRIEEWKFVGNKGTLINTSSHPFNRVPIVHYINNDDRFGDFEKVITLIDDYNLRLSDRSNEQDFGRNAYLLIQGMDMRDEKARKAIKNMKEMYAFGLPQGADMRYITKNIDDQFVVNHLNELKENIHKFSMVPDLSDEKFSGNLSGVAIKFKIWGLEQLTSLKEKCFREALNKRMNLIASLMEIKGETFDVNNVEIIFTRNLPVNNTEEVDNVMKLKDLLPFEYLLSLLSFIDDPGKILDLIDDEKYMGIEAPEELSDEQKKQDNI